jgi:hypothetical protein
MLAQQYNSRRATRRIGRGEFTTGNRALAGEGGECRRDERRLHHGDAAAWLQQAPIVDIERLDGG